MCSNNAPHRFSHPAHAPAVPDLHSWQHLRPGLSSAYAQSAAHSRLAAEASSVHIQSHILHSTPLYPRPEGSRQAVCVCCSQGCMRSALARRTENNSKDRTDALRDREPTLPGDSSWAAGWCHRAPDTSNRGVPLPHSLPATILYIPPPTLRHSRSTGLHSTSECIRLSRPDQQTTCE